MPLWQFSMGTVIAIVLKINKQGSLFHSPPAAPSLNWLYLYYSITYKINMQTCHAVHVKGCLVGHSIVRQRIKVVDYVNLAHA